MTTRPLCAWRMVLVVFVAIAAFNPIEFCNLNAQERDPTVPYPIKGQRVIEPDFFNLDIPAGELRLPVDGECVRTHDENDDQCVARVHIKVGRNFVVLLPSGTIVAREADEVESTDEAFTPLSHMEVAQLQLDALKEKGMRDFRVETTENFVLVYNTSPEFARVTGKVMQTMLEGLIEYTREQGIETHLPDVPLPIIAFHRAAQFQQFDRVPDGVAAYYDPMTNRVVLKEQSQFTGTPREDLGAQELLSTIAHEGCHQLFYNIGVQQRLSRWPMWLGEGMPEYMAPTKPGRKFEWKGAGKVNDLRMYELERFMQLQFVEGFDGETVRTTVKAAGLNSTGYAAAWTITHHLATNHKEQFDRYMRYLSRMAPLHGMMPSDEDDSPEFVEDNLLHFTTFFGDEVEAFENDMVQFLSKLRYTSPMQEYPHYVGTALVPGVDGNKVHACFFPDQGSVQEWAAAVAANLTDYEREHTEIEVTQHSNRGSANAYIKRWKRENSRGRGRGRR